MGRARRLFVVISIALGACGSCAGGAVAELLERNGSVEGTPAGGDVWSDAPIGRTFQIGEAVRTGEAATARLRVGERGGVRMQPGTILRFLSERPDRAAGVRVEAGEVELDADEAIDVETSAGSVTLLGGGRARVRGGEREPRIEVIAGRVEFEDQGQTRVAEAGDAVVLAVGRVIFEDADPELLAAAPPRAPEPAPIADSIPNGTDPSGDADRDDDTASREGDTNHDGDDDAADHEHDIGVDTEPSPARAHVEIPAGESAVIHDPGSPPTLVRIAFGERCPGIGLVTISGGRRRLRYRGEGGAIVPLAPGRARYAIQCGNRSSPGGTIQVRRDDGTHRLQSVAPRNVVDADGRTYDVLYQNALPILTVRWREAGAGGPFALHVLSGGRDRTFAAPGGRAELGSGEVGEGTHRVFFTAGARRSPETTVRIRFDNAAPAASLREPSSSAPLSGSRAHVAGVVLAGFSVRAGGVELPIDPQQRFSGEVAIPADLDALAVRISHPRHGVHYYLRRVAR